MGNYTQIEGEFNTIINKKVEQLFLNDSNIRDNNEKYQREINKIVSKTLFEMRNERMRDLCSVTNRNLICYVSAWLQSSNSNPEFQINDNDMNGLMNAVSGMHDRNNGVDILLHTPGGIVTATESIVSYLRKLFDGDIRVIVPHMAMSAGTMIACASKEIIMGKESSLGPIDPQYRNVPAQGVLKEFERAIKEIVDEPNKSLIWREIIQQYRPTFVGECDNVVNMSHDLVEGWLSDCMFKGVKNKKCIVSKILDELASHDASKVHDRHYDFERCKELGLNVVALEDSQELQDKVLSLYHCYLLSIYRLPVLKFIESQNGQTFVINGSR